MNPHKSHQKNIETLTEDTFRLLFETATEGLVVANDRGEIVLVNPRISELFGYKVSELVGKEIEMLIPDRHKHHHIAHRKEYNAHPSRRLMGTGRDLWAKRKNGTEFPVEISLNHFQKDNQLLVMALITDITERKIQADAIKKSNEDLEKRVDARTNELGQAINALKYSNEELQDEIRIRREAEAKTKKALQKEKELNELKSRFVSLASHEFRTPLGTVLSSASLISKYHSPTDEEKRTKHINRIKSAVNYLTAILNDFLSLDKLEQGKISINISVFDIVSFSKEITDELQEVAKEGQTIFYQHKGKKQEVNLDRQLLKNIVFNLLSNAIKYSPEGKPIHFNTEINNSQLKISVRDEGMGIPKEDQQHLFERFFRAKNSINIQGTGLGLNIVKKYLDLLNGKIDFKSKENYGTTFIVNLPIKK